MPAKAASHFIHHACDGQLSAAPPCSSCLRRQASHFIHHACGGQLSAAPPMLVMPAKAGIAFHPSCLRRSFQAEQKLSSACGSRATFSLRAQRESSQRERAPRGGAFRPSMDGKSVSRGRAFRAGILPARKGLAILGKARYAASSSPPHRRRGAPEKQARILCARRPWRHELVATFPHAFSLHLSLG